MVCNESPGCTDALILRAEALEQLGQCDDAMGITNRLLRDGFSNNKLLNLRARIFFDQERFDQAQKHLQEGLFCKNSPLGQETRFSALFWFWTHALSNVFCLVLRADPDDAKAAKLLKRIRKVIRLKSEGDDGYKAQNYQGAADAYTACLVSASFSCPKFCSFF